MDLNELEKAVLDYCGRTVEASRDGRYIRLVLPGAGPSGKLTAVYLCREPDGSWEVHDGAQAAGELYCQGIRLTPRQQAMLAGIAERLGVDLVDGHTFSVRVKDAEVARAVWRVRDAAVATLCAFSRERL